MQRHLAVNLQTAMPIFSLFLVVTASVFAPEDSTVAIAGVVLDRQERLLAGVNVFVEGTTVGTSTRDNGAFRLIVTSQPEIVLIVRAIGFVPARQIVRLPLSAPLRISLAPVTLDLATVRVEAGRHVAGAEHGATMTALEITSIPGSRGDMARAFQTLPGVVTVDEGTGLYVRGGDAPETKTVLNGVELLDPQRVETPIGSLGASVDPFLLEGITFATGAFGVRFGNALSAIGDLETQGRPAVSRTALHASLASISARHSHPLGRQAGFHVTGNVSDSRLAVGLNGSPFSYVKAPHSHTVSASAIWSYRRSAEIKAFVIDRANGSAVWSPALTWIGISRTGEHNSAGIVSWADRIGSVAVRGGAAIQRLSRSEEFGTLDLRTSRRSTQFFVTGDRPLTPALSLSAGVDGDLAIATYDGVIPLRTSEAGSDQTGRAIDKSVDNSRLSFHTEATWQFLRRIKARAGIRTDRNSLTGERTVDPRISITALAGNAIVVLAAGRYHQVADPVLYAFGASAQSLPSMRAEQATIGVSTGGEERMFRVEAFVRRFERLALLDTDRNVRGAGVGEARGAEAFLRGTLPSDVEARVVYTLTDATRTDARSGVLARAPFDVRHSGFVALERTWLDRFTIGAGLRYASGRPYTDIIGATPANDAGAWSPEFGTPFGAVMPALFRADLSGSVMHRLPGNKLIVAYVSLTNVTDRHNVARYHFAPDFSTRTPVRSQAGRGVFFGASLSY